MSTTPIETLYPFAERFVVDTDGTDAVDIWDIPAGTIITRVLVQIDVDGTGDSGGNIIVGDDDDDNGYILAANVCGGTAGTVYGDHINELGEYLEPSGAVGSYEPGCWKTYSSAGKELKLDCSAALTTEATLSIYVFGFRASI